VVAVHETAEGVGRNKAVSARVTATAGALVAERVMTFTYGGTIRGGHVVLGFAH
jgi:hypothetical protein